VQHDFLWAMGILLLLEIRMAKIELEAREALADQSEAQ
jgi:hypothetical protein